VSRRSLIVCLFVASIVNDIGPGWAANGDFMLNYVEAAVLNSRQPMSSVADTLAQSTLLRLLTQRQLPFESVILANEGHNLALFDNDITTSIAIEPGSGVVIAVPTDVDTDTMQERRATLLRVTLRFNDVDSVGFVEALARFRLALLFEASDMEDPYYLRPVGGLAVRSGRSHAA
jgi:hypothetical protein